MRFLQAAPLALILAGCTAPPNLRARMEQAAAPPAGVQQTMFAHIGEVRSSQGTFHVATQRLVLSGVPAPRGLPHRLLLFDENARPVAGYEYAFDSAQPLWCEGSRVYLFGFGVLRVAGSFQHVPPDPRLHTVADHGGHPTGNVIDFAAGPRSPVLTREKRYGSSGGIEDDPWQPRRRLTADPTR